MNCYWIENTEVDIAKLRKASKGVAVLPMGAIESHGPHLPLGSDIICVNEAVKRAIAKETAAVLPTLVYTYVVEAQSLPGAIHMPSQLMLEQMEAICDEVYRNGFDKILVVHGHGGNGAHTNVFSQRMLEAGKPYAVYNLGCFGGDLAAIKAIIESSLWGHACEAETSTNLAAMPQLVHLDRLKGRSIPARKGPDVGPAQSPAWWIAAFPEMACGEPLKGTVEKGERIYSVWAKAIVETIRKVKADTITLPAIRKHLKRAKEVRGKINSER